MKKHLLLCSFFLLTGISLTAQVGWKCGTPPLRMPLASQIQLKNSIAAGLDTATLYIPVTVNIIGNDNGTGYYSFSQTMEALCKLQAEFNPHGFHFYIEHLKYINSSAFYDMTATYLGSGTVFQFIEDNNTLNTMNVYITSDAEGISGFVSVGFENYDYSSFPVAYIPTQSEGIVLDKDYLNIWDHLFTHEAGHFFGLDHTFASANWTEFQATGTPDTLFHADYDPENDTTYYHFSLVERVDGVHCEVAGDLICDTPPDYLNGGFTCNGDNQSPVVQTDPTGASFRSDGTLYMSYSNDACQNRFSPGQAAWMRAVAQGPRDYLLYNQTPPAPFSTPVWAMIYPPDGETVAISDSITLEWEDIPGADFVVFEFGRVVNANLYLPIVKDVIPNESTFKVQVNPQLNYYWIVKAVNRYYPCQVVADTSYFSTTLVSTHETRPADLLQLYPNPASSRLYWRLPEAAANLQNISIQLFDAQGQLLQYQSLPTGQALDVQGISSGMYTLKVVAGERVYVGKFVKQ